MKSRTTSAILTIIFGPLGMLYTHAGYAILLFIAAVISVPTAVGPLICWVVAIFWGDKLAKESQGVPVAAGAAPAPRVKAEKTTFMGVGIVELIITTAIIFGLIFVLPDMLGAGANESAINFYLRYFE